MTLHDILARFPKARKSGKSWSARCPAHDDRHASLSISRGTDGRVLLNCHAGCSADQVCRSLGLEMKDLFPNDNHRAARSSKAAKKVVATYDYTDEAGALIFQVVRFEPKDFRHRRPNGACSPVNNMDGVRRVPYNLPELAKTEQVLVVEGEKDCETARSFGVVATTNSGGAGKWRDEYSEFLRGKRVVVIPDADEPGRKHAQRVASSLVGKAASIKFIELPGSKDLSEWRERGGTRDQLLTLIANATEWTPPAVPSGAAIVREIERLLSNFILLPLHTLLAVALWIIGTHLFEAGVDRCVFDAFPFLILCSPTPRCGKTRTLEVSELVVSRPRRTTNISEAALFRLADSQRPTFLIDEQEGLNEKTERAEALRGLLNAGHRRGAKATRCAGANRDEVRDFDVYSPKMLAGIGDLPSTLRDRAIVLNMQRRQASQSVARFVYRVVAQSTTDLRIKIEAWVTANRERIGAIYETVPSAEFLSDREEENWSPLFAILATADPSRIDELRSDAEHLSQEKSESDDQQTLALEVLKFALEVWLESEDTIASRDLISRLQQKEDAPTFKPESGRPDVEVSARRLARWIRGFGVRPLTVRLATGGTARGYKRAELIAALTPYLTVLSNTSNTNQQNHKVRSDFASDTESSVSEQDSSGTSTKQTVVSGVLDKSREEGA